MTLNFKETITVDDRLTDGVKCISLAATRGNFGRIGSLEHIAKVTAPKTNNRFAHVFWSKPALMPFETARWSVGHQYEMTLPITALSLALLWEMDQEVVLYTDSAGERLLSCLGYEKIYNIFDRFSPHTDFWAAGKIEALRHEPLDSCLIDNDIFLYDGDIIDTIHTYSIIGSHEEDTTAYKALLDFAQFHLPRLAGDNQYSTNCGILKINNVQYKDNFILSYWSALKQFSNPEVLEKIKTAGMGAYCVDLAIEQFAFHKICQPNHTIKLADTVSETRGLVHLISFEKYLKIPQILDILKIRYPYMYETVINKWHELGFAVQLEGVEYGL